MAKELGGASRTEGRTTLSGALSEARREARIALELVAVRGADVLGVRHVLEGGKVWVGQAPESIARIPMGEFGGRAALLAEVSDEQFVLHVPPRARARMHGHDGLGRLSIGPTMVSLAEGDRVVIVLGQVQIRARIVPIEAVTTPEASGETKRWIAVMGAVYLLALLVCALVAPARPGRLPHGGLQRLLEAATEVSGSTVQAAGGMGR